MEARKGPPLAWRLRFGDPELIRALRALPRILEPGQWKGVWVRFRAGWPRFEYIDPDDPDTLRIADEITAGRAMVVEDRTLDPHDGRVLVRTAEGEMWCDPDDLQETPVEVEARTKEAAIQRALSMAAEGEPEEWEPTDDVEVHEA